MTARSDWVFCSGTRIEGSFRDVVDAAAAGGFGRISIWQSQLEMDRKAGMSVADMREYLGERDVRVHEVEPILSWIPVDALPEYAVSVASVPPEVFLDWAVELGAPTVLATDGFGAGCTLPALAESFGRLCDRASDRGLEVKFEFLPWALAPDARTANRMLDLADRPNAGLMIDTWHVLRGPTDAAQLEALDGRRVKGVQLSDGPAQPVLAELPLDAMHHRCMPGQGAAGVVEIVRILDRIGSTAPLGVEVFSDALNARSNEEVGREAGEAMRAVVDEARG